MIGSETAVLINNAIARLDRCRGIILVGLDDNQKSYLRIPKKVPVVEISTLEDVEKKLLPLSANKELLACREDDILNGLYRAKRESKRLVIDNNAPVVVPFPVERDKGIVVLEAGEEALAVIGVNYAHSINANLSVVESYGKENRYSVEKNIQKWKEHGGNNQIQKVLNKINRRIGNIRFDELKFATFFTNGLPYSLGINNIIPCSYVHLSLRPDLFVFNSIIFESIERFHSAVVFSPSFFDDEETRSVAKLFHDNKYYLRPLIGNNATVRNLDFHAQHFPYDILHICTHGGEVDGYAVSEKYKDRKGVEHTVEYDEVVGFAPVIGKDLIEVHRKTFFRKFDGYVWMSEELKKQKYPNYVFEDLRKSLFQKDDLGKNAKRSQKDKIPTSCAIACIDSIHQGTFRILASHSSPLVFNNACWSWSEVAHFFLAGGARGYIGTLWAIENNHAVLGANAFYGNLFNGTILEAFFEAIKSIKDTRSKDIYIYWGLHFTTLTPANNRADSRAKVFRELVRSFFSWLQKVKTTKSTEVKKNSIDVLRQVHTELVTQYEISDYEKLDKEVMARMSEFAERPKTRELKNQTDDVLSFSSTPSIEHQTEYRKRSR
jgi:hypothetical protein